MRHYFILVLTAMEAVFLLIWASGAAQRPIMKEEGLGFLERHSQSKLRYTAHHVAILATASAVTPRPVRECHLRRRPHSRGEWGGEVESDVVGDVP